MTARRVVIASLACALVSTGCLKFYEVSVETPIQAKLDVTPFDRVLVAGFVSGGSRSIDGNTETARLLRSQLRSKSELRVIDADVLPLVEEMDRRRGANPDAAETRIETERDLQAYDALFADAAYWKKIAEEYQQPLIVTGTLLFTDVARSGMVSQVQAYIDQMGRQQYREVREFASLRGYALTPKFIFIDGRTGEQLYSEAFHEESLYPETQNTPALSAYFEMMDKLLPGFLNTLSTQTIRGTRVLLK
jgi:hypothetical protein